MKAHGTDTADISTLWFICIMCRYFDLLLLFYFVQLLDENAQLIRVSEAG